MKINAVGDFATALGIGLGILAGLFFVHSMEEHHEGSDGRKTAQRRARKMLLFAALATCLSIFLPSKTDIAILVGASVALDMAKSPEGVKVGTLLRGKVNEVLDEAIKEMTPKGK